MGIIKAKDLDHPQILHDSSHEEEAFQKGREEGEALGYEKACLENQSAIHLIQKIAQSMLEKKEELLEVLKPQLIHCSIAICERMIRKELRDPEILIALIQSLIKEFSLQSSHSPLQLRLASKDYEMLEKHFSLEIMKDIQFCQDSTIQRGDCRIENNFHLLNYTIQYELERLEACILRC